MLKKKICQTCAHLDQKKKKLAVPGSTLVHAQEQGSAKGHRPRKRTEQRTEHMWGKPVISWFINHSN